MRARTIITGGGTGGHVYPALSVIEHLAVPDSSFVIGVPDDQPRITSHEPHTTTPVYIGNARGLERTIVPRTGIDCYLFPMVPPRSPLGLALAGLAIIRTRRVMRRLRPRATIATGGYVSAPVALASWFLRVPIILFLPDLIPGRAVAFLAPLARRIAVSADGARACLPAKKTVVTGYPVRTIFFSASRELGRRRFDLPDDARVVCVFGGSQGARSINEALARHLACLLEQSHVIHVCGEKRRAEAEAVAASLTDEQRSRYRLFSYLHDEDMADALAAADLAVCRSGASTLGELPATGTPAILVPLPERHVHQAENAEYLAAAGAAVIVQDDDLPERLGAVVEALLGDPDRLTKMAEVCRSLARPDAAARIAGLIDVVATGSDRGAA